MIDCASFGVLGGVGDSVVVTMGRVDRCGL